MHRFGSKTWRIAWRERHLTQVVAITLLSLSGCALPRGVLEPVTATAPGTSKVEMLVATTRMRTTPAEMFSGERGPGLDFADIVVSIPPDSAREIGEVQKPHQLPGNPATDFVTLKADYNDRRQAMANFHRLVHASPRKQVLVFVHGFNNHFEDAVFRFAQFVHDSGAGDVVPILFTWPSKGSVFAYGYDRESANYSRDALEQGLRALSRNPEVNEITIVAHSMGNWVTLEALRQMAIRDGKVAEKIHDVMLAAPDVDVDNAREQVTSMGPKRPRFTLFTSVDDHALALSRKFWGEPRLGSIDPRQEPEKSILAAEGIDVIDLSGVSSPDQLHHGTFAQTPRIVQLIGRSIASGQTLTDAKVGVGEQIFLTTAGAAAGVGHAAGLIVSAPVAVLDPVTREQFGEEVGAFGNSIRDAATPLQ
jgi:esterase/lipase superfamily enzyme